MLRALYVLGLVDSRLNDRSPSTPVDYPKHEANRSQVASTAKSRSDLSKCGHRSMRVLSSRNDASHMVVADAKVSATTDPITPKAKRKRQGELGPRTVDLPPTPHSLQTASDAPKRPRKRMVPVVEIKTTVETHAHITPRTQHAPLTPLSTPIRQQPAALAKKAKTEKSKRAKVMVTLEGRAGDHDLKDETFVELTDKVHLIQERVRSDPWRMLVANSLLNVTSGRAASPIYEEVVRRWPSPQALADANFDDLSALLHPLGLYATRAASLIRFSRQYIDLGWPVAAATAVAQPVDSPISKQESRSRTILSTTSRPRIKSETAGAELPPPPPLPTSLDVRIFHGAGTYASDSFRIFSDLLPGHGGPAREALWLEKQLRAERRMRHALKMDGPAAKETQGVRHGNAYPAGRRSPTSTVFGASVHFGEHTVQGMAPKDDEEMQRVGERAMRKGIVELGQWLSDEEGDDSGEEWRHVRPTDRPLRRYLTWRWGIEGIVYDVHSGPRIIRPRDKRRLKWVVGA